METGDKMAALWGVDQKNAFDKKLYLKHVQQKRPVFTAFCTNRIHQYRQKSQCFCEW